MAAVIGALRADLSAGWAEFAADMGKAADSVKGFGKTFKSVASDLRGAGMALSAAITLPVAAFGGAVVVASKDFEAAMNRVKAATGAAGAELEALNDKARAIGMDPNNTANAIQAADAMEVLAKNGLTATEILAGAADAATKLAAATGSELAPAADVATDVMLQFGKSAGDLMPVVDGITGTLLASKFGFDDYRLALGQAGGVAGGLGVEFTEFNAVIAATSALFSDGSDAGTSYKTFLTSLTPASVQAANAMKRYGLEFFDAQGRMKSMADIAGILKDRLGGLSEEAKTDVLQTIFGRDAMRTAIGLINAGAEGVRALDEEIQKASAQEQLDARMAGLSGAMTGFSKALTELKIAIGDSGLLDMVAGFVRSLTDMVKGLSSLPAPVLGFITALAGLAAVIGPLLFVAGAFMGALTNLAPLATFAGAAFTSMGAFLLPLLPIIAAVAAAVAALVGVWMLVRDQVQPVLDALGERFKTVLGPEFQKLAEAFKGAVAAIGDAFAGMAEGPIGKGFAVIKNVMGGLAAITTRVLGEGLLAVIRTLTVAFTGAFENIANVVKLLSRLFSGDFKGAWDQAKKTVLDAVSNLLDVWETMFPGIRGVLTDIMAVVRYVFVEKIAPIFSWIGDRAGDIATAFGAAFGPAIQWAKDLYAGVKSWIADRLGPILQWARDRIAELQSAFNGLVEKAQTANPAPPPGGAPRTAPPPPPAPRTAPPPAGGGGAPAPSAGGSGGGSRGRGRQGPSVEELERQHALDVAQEKSDQRALDAARDLEERAKRLEAYRKAGLSAAAATAKAESEVAELARLRADEYERTLRDMSEGVALAVAEAGEQWQTVAAIERAQDLRALTLDYQKAGLDLAEAEAAAARDLATIEQARADARARWFADDARRIEMENAAARGDTARLEALQRAESIEARIRELRSETNGAMTEDAARSQAEAEAANLSMSELIGQWREFSAQAQRDDYTRGMAELNRLLEAGILNVAEYRAAAATLGDTLNANLAKASPMFAEWSNTVDLFGDSLEDALTPGADLNAIWESFRLQLLKILILQPLIDKLKNSLKSMGDGVGSMGGGGGGGAGNWLSTAFSIGKSIFGGFKATGGGVMGSKAYVVGEEGPEIFRPGVSGAIVPNDALTAGPGAGPRISAPVTVYASDSVLTSWVEREVQKGIAAAVQMAVPASVEASLEAVPAEMARQQRDMF